MGGKKGRCICPVRSVLFLLGCEGHAAAEGAAVTGSIRVKGRNKAAEAAAFGLGGCLLRLGFLSIVFHTDRPSFIHDYFYVSIHK